jgi:glycerol-3-phosphate dehydrogenase
LGALSRLNRKENLRKMENEYFDMIIIGGGITGAGIALDAVTRGMKVAVIDMQDFAAGTSSRSTKLVHGGLRYLQQFEFKLVAEVGREREIVYENGPHVTTPERMLLPFHQGSNLGPLTTNVGLRMYDALAGVKRKERRSMLNKEGTLQKEPLIKKEGLKGGGYYVEYKTDDARLTIEVIKKAAEHGAAAINYLEAADFLYNEENQISGVQAIDHLTGQTVELKGKKVINAAGPWAEEVGKQTSATLGKTLLLTKGIHLVFDQAVFPLKQAVYFDTPDKRMIFAIPREAKVYVGTTDTIYAGDLKNPRVTKEDRDYILGAIQHIFPEAGITSADVESSWAGLRPLIAEKGKENLGEISRKDEIFISPTGLVSIAGGKLTGYRKMAEQIVDLVADQFKKEEGILYSESMTRNLPISGGEVGGSHGFANFKKQWLDELVSSEMDHATAEQLIQMYGGNISSVFQFYKDNKAESEKRNIPRELLAQLQYAHRLF